MNECLNWLVNHDMSLAKSLETCWRVTTIHLRRLTSCVSADGKKESIYTECQGIAS